MPFDKELGKMIEEAKSKYTWELVTAGHNLQENLYQLRKHHGYSQRAVGAAIGVAQPHIVRHESQGYMPSLDSLAKYAHLYDVTIADLLGEPMRLGPQPLVIWDEAKCEPVQIGVVNFKTDTATVTERWL